MELSVGLVILIIAVQTLCFTVKRIAGFGDPLISNPIFSMVMDNRHVSPMNLCLSLPVNLFISWKNRKAFSMREALPTAACILLGVVPGTLMLKYASSWVLKALLGVLVIGIGVEMITRKRSQPAKSNPVIRSLVSVCSGFTAGLFGINLFFVAYAERTATSRDGFRGNICFIFLIENIFRVCLYAFTGILTREALLLALVSLPGMITGLWLGGRLDNKLSEATVRWVVIAMFMLGGVSILAKSLIWHS